MRILHFAIGLPPFRRGGMVQYVQDLMQEQAMNPGNQVALLFPGGKSLLPCARICERKCPGSVRVFEIVNSSDVVLMGGVSHPERILHPFCDLADSALVRLLDRLRPQILHVHSLMGIPKSLLSLARCRGIRICYTTHDYYGLCPTVNFVKSDQSVCAGASARACWECNAHAYSRLELFLHSLTTLYAVRKWVVKARDFLKKWYRLAPHPLVSNSRSNHADVHLYGELQQYYQRLFSQIHYFVFNSRISAERFQKALPGISGSVLAVTIRDIQDRRRPLTVDKKRIRIGYMGGESVAKGYPLLLDALHDLLRRGKTNWGLTVWGVSALPGILGDRIRLGHDFQRSELANVYGSMDLLVVPSIWYETFGLVVLEALSFGVPVLVSDTVGAQDLVKALDPAFVYAGGRDGLVETLGKLLDDVSMLQGFNARLLQSEFSYSFSAHEAALAELYTRM